MMRAYRNLLTLAILALAPACTGHAFADEAATAGRAVLEKTKNAVVTVSLVIKNQFSMRGESSNEQESKSEATGTVIDPSGLTVLSLAETDPTSLFKSMMEGMGDMGNMKIESALSDVTIILEDGKELPAKVVLRDKDLDLAFIRPLEKPAQPLPAVDLKDAVSPQMLDQVLVLNRLGKVANRAYAVSVDRIEAIISKPRTFFVPGRGQSTGSLGSPVFSLEGKIVGVALLRTIGGGMGGGGMFGMGGMEDNVLPVILPAADILEAAQQAPASAADVKEEPVPAPAPAPATPDAVTIPAPDAAPAEPPAPPK